MIVAIAVARHVESVTGSGAASAVVTHQEMVESHRIRHREWSRIVAINMACQGVMELLGSAAGSGAVLSVIVACQGVQTCRPKFGWSR